MRGIGAGTFDVGQTSFDNILYWSGREGAEMIDIRQQFGTPPPLGTTLDRFYDTSYYRDARGQ